MAKDNNWQLVLTVGIITLLLGGILGATAFPKTETVYKDKIIETKVNVPVEVIKEVEVVKVVSAPSELDNALVTFLKAVENEEDEAGNEIDLLKGYDFDEVSLNKLYEDHVVTYSDDKIIVDFQVKLKYKEDGESSEKETYNVTVTYETDEDSTVEAIVA